MAINQLITAILYLYKYFCLKHALINGSNP